MTQSQSITLAQRLQFAAHFMAFVFVLSSLFVYGTVAASDKGRGPSIEKRVAHLTEKLGLSTQQQKDITAVLESARSDMEKLRNPDATKEERKAMREQLKAMRDSTESKIEQILTPEQREKYKQLREDEREEMKDRLRDRMEERRK